MIDIILKVLVIIGLVSLIVLMIVQIYYFRKQTRLDGNFQKERKKYLEKISKGAKYIDDYLISLEKPADLAAEKYTNIVTNLREIIVANRRTIDSYFDKFNKLQRKIKKLEDRIKANEIRRDFKRAEEAQD